MQSIQQLDDPKNTHNDQCVLQKANVFPSPPPPRLPQIKELEAPRVPWAGRLKKVAPAGIHTWVLLN